MRHYVQADLLHLLKVSQISYTSVRYPIVLIDILREQEYSGLLFRRAGRVSITSGTQVEACIPLNVRGKPREEGLIKVLHIPLSFEGHLRPEMLFGSSVTLLTPKRGARRIIHNQLMVDIELLSVHFNNEILQRLTMN